MTTQEKKAFLQQYNATEQEEQRLSAEIERWKIRSQQTRSDYDTVKFICGPDPTLEYATRQIGEMTRQLIIQRSKLVALRQSIEAAIGSVPDDRLKGLLRLRYIEGMTWEAIADQMNYSYMQISRLHKKALDELNM